MYKRQVEARVNELILEANPVTTTEMSIEEAKKLGAMALFGPGTDMVVSVTTAKANPYYNCFEEDADGFLKLSKGNGQYVRRQDAPEAWEYNGAVYVIDPEALRKSPLSKFRHIRKYVMDEIHSLDLDTMLDWKIAELMLKEGMLDNNGK
mgnify:CR=1 FL=1